MTFKTRMHNLFVGLRLTDWIIAAFTAMLGVVAYLQYREMKKGGEDTHTLAQAALAQAQMSQQTFDAIFHPNVEVFSIAFNQQAITDDGFLSYTLKNIGGAPAENLGLHIVALVGNTKKDISPERLPSELGVGATFTDDAQVTTKTGTSEMLDGNRALKVSYTIEYAAHGRPTIQRCTTFTLEPARREMVPAGECK